MIFPLWCLRLADDLIRKHERILVPSYVGNAARASVRSRSQASASVRWRLCRPERSVTRGELLVAHARLGLHILDGTTISVSRAAVSPSWPRNKSRTLSQRVLAWQRKEAVFFFQESGFVRRILGILAWIALCVLFFRCQPLLQSTLLVDF